MSDACESMRGALLDYVDGDADTATRNEVEAHLAICEKCRLLVQGVGSTPPDFGRPALAASFWEGMRLDLHARIDERLVRDDPPMPGFLARLFWGWLPVPKPLAWAMVVVIFVLASDLIQRAPLLPRFRPPSPLPASHESPRILMDGVDRLGALAASSQA